MDYTLEEIYVMAGREDKTVCITFKGGSNSADYFGDYIVGEIVYDQLERLTLEELIQQKPYNKTGAVRIKYLGDGLSEQQISTLLSVGIQSAEIADMSYYIHGAENTYFSNKIRKLNTIEVKMKMLPRGADIDWMYGFAKQRVFAGESQTPYERTFYLAGKLYYEPKELSSEERIEIYSDNGNIEETIEFQYLGIKYHRKEANDEEVKRIGFLLAKKKRRTLLLVNEYLKEAGSSLKKLSEENIDLVVDLFEKALHFKDRRLTHTGDKTVYLSLSGYMHVFTRHVVELKFNKQFSDKTNFQYEEHEVLRVMQHVIQMCNDDIQMFFKNHPGKRYSRYGKKEVYFQGDYYTFHIEADGQISTFYKSTPRLKNK